MKRTSLLLLAALLVLVLAAVPGGRMASAQESVTLTLLHNSDGESALLSTTNTVPAGGPYGNPTDIILGVGGVANFKTLLDEQIADAGGEGNAVVTVYAGDAFLASSTLVCSLPPLSEPIYDAVAQRQMPYTAHIFGNHEFDFNPDFLEQFTRTFDDGSGLTQPFLSANLDFSAEPGFADLIDADGLIDQQAEDNRPVARSMIYTDPATGAVFGIVGATTPELRTISSPRDVQVTETLEETAEVVQAEIDRLQSEGVNKIIFVSHLQFLPNDIELIGMLSGVDLAVGGGGDEVLLNSSLPDEEQLLPGEASAVFGEYPYEVTDADGNSVFLVTTKGNYKYLGRLDVTFDASGDVTAIDLADSYPRRNIPDTPENAAAIAALGLTDATALDPAIVASVTDPVSACVQGFATTILAYSEVVLDVSRDTVRGAESNAGNMIADAFIYAYEQLGAQSGVTALDNPVIAFNNGGGIRQNAGDFLSGEISRQNTLDVLPFANDVVVIENVSPETLKEILETSVRDPLPDGGFLQIAGMFVRYDMTQPVGSRVDSLELADGTPMVVDGAVVPGAPDVNAVTNSFTAAGGDDYPVLVPLDKIALADDGGRISYERAWVKYLTESTDDFPVGAGGLPTIRASDSRYVPGGEGRIVFGGRGSSEVYVVHAVPNLTVDVYVDGNLLLRRFRPRQIAGPVTLPEGRYQVVVVPTGGDPNNPAIARGVVVPPNRNVSLVAHLAADGTPTLTSFINNVTPPPAGNQSRLVVRHVAAAPAVDAVIGSRGSGGPRVIQTFPNVSNGLQAQLDVPFNGRTYTLALNAPGTSETVFGPRPLQVRGNHLFAFYIFGSLEDGTLSLLRQRIPLP